MTQNPRFWKSLAALAKSGKVVIDRPKGSPHPRFPDFIYPLDYGYVEGTCGGDGQGIDVWLGSGCRDTVTAIIVCTDLAKRDGEIKILLGCTEDEEKTLLEIHNRGSQSAILVPAR